MNAHDANGFHSREADPPPPDLLARLEALLFAAGRSVGVEALTEAAGVGVVELAEALEVLEQDLVGRGIQLVEEAGGWRLVTRPEHAEAVRRLLQPQPVRLSAARLETLAVIAYHQPASRAQVEAVRGVDCQATLRTLLDLELIEVRGRREDSPGRPLLYGTTPRFLEVFGLNAVEDLPKLEELGGSESPEE